MKLSAEETACLQQMLTAAVEAGPKAGRRRKGVVVPDMTIPRRLHRWFLRPGLTVTLTLEAGSPDDAPTAEP